MNPIKRKTTVTSKKTVTVGRSEKIKSGIANVPSGDALESFDQAFFSHKKMTSKKHAYNNNFILELIYVCKKFDNLLPYI